MTINKLTWEELRDFLRAHNDRKGVIVFKNGPWFKQEMTLEARSYVVKGNCKHFLEGMISDSIFGTSLDGSDEGVRLDWYFLKEDKDKRWQVEYCYVLD